MTNGNDWSSQPGNDWGSPSQPQPGAESNFPAPQPPGNHPLGDNQLNFGAFIDVVRWTFAQAKEGPILKALIGLALVTLVFSLLQGFLQSGAQLLGGGFGTVLGVFGGLVGFVGFVVSLVVVGLQYSLYKPLVEKLSGNPLPQTEPIALIKDAQSRVFMVAIAYVLTGFATGIGLFLCVLPGLAIGFLFSQAPYLIASRDEELVSAFQSSFERAKKHWHLVLMAVGTVLIGALAIGIPAGILLIAAAFVPVVGPILSAIGGWLITVAFTVFGFIVTAAAFATIDELEGERKLAR